ncbi:hypothetical protein EDB80DRAFT_28739 [Ilyonectria destructans]|nr:hypothetical protein EDB80DRAFT_28739 [Ilyonectria destructans]
MRLQLRAAVWWWLGEVGAGTGPKVLFPAACFQLPCFHANALFTTALGDWPSGLQGRESCSGALGGTNSGQDIHGRRCRGSGATATSLKETLTRQPGPLCAGAEAAMSIATPVRASEGLLQSRDHDCQGPVAGQDLAPEKRRDGMETADTSFGPQWGRECDCKYGFGGEGRYAAEVVGKVGEDGR